MDEAKVDKYGTALTGAAAGRVCDRLLVCGADTAEIGRSHAAEERSGRSGNSGIRRYADQAAGKTGGYAGRAGSAGAARAGAGKHIA